MFGGDDSSTEYEDIVNKATDENLTSENWELILNLCDKVLDEGQGGAHAAIVTILKRLAHRNPNVQLYALTLAESLSKNVGIEIDRELASRAFTQVLEKLITDRNTHEKVRKRALRLIAMWASEFENDSTLGIMEECYVNLKSKNYEFEQIQEAPPPTVDDEIRRKEEELQRVLEMPMQDEGGRNPELQPEAEPAPETPVKESVYGLGPGQTAPDSPLAPPSLASYSELFQDLQKEDTKPTRRPVEYTPIDAQAPPFSTDDAVPPPVYVTSDRDIRVERLGDELSPDSSVWPTYVATAASSDAEMVDSWNKGLDVLLIFSSLFSAVVTAFVIESAKDLKPDYEQINALLTAHMLKGLNNPGNSSYLADLPSPERLLSFEKPALAKAVNILWFAALGFSLSGVLVAMLAKQWLAAYGSQAQDEPHKTACQRQRKYDCLNQWSLPWILALLPALLHASLFLFLIGLIAYMWQLDSTISLITCVILGTLFLFYFASGALAAFSTNCPYNTPLSDFIRSIFRLRDDSRFQADIMSKDLSSKAVMWLATTKEPKTVSAALQSLAGLRRGFTGYEADQAQHLAKLAFERLRGCFIPEWRNGDTYSLRTEQQYEASCYCRTLMHFIDDTRVDPRTFSAILDEPSLLVFIQLLASCSDPSISLLALCDHQRLLHQIELRRWISVPSPDGGHDLPAAAKMVCSGPSQKNMKNIVKCLNDYLKGSIFLHPYAIEIAVETIGFAPLSWTTTVFTRDPPLSNIVDPLVKLLGATRESVFGVRRATARTLSILARIHGISRMDDPVDDFALRFDSAMLIVKDVEGGDPSDSGVRDMLLAALSQFVVKFEEDGISTIEICEELFYECDRRFGDELPTFSDKAAVTTLLPLLLVGSLKQDQKARIIRRLYGNAVSAAQNDSLPDDGFLHNITPPNPFPPEAVSYLLKTLEGSKDTSYSWLRDVSITLYLITRNSTHRHCFLEEALVVISLIRNLELDEVSSHLFWILSDSANETIIAGTKPELTQKLIDAGMLDVVYEYCTKIGLTPSDVHLWSSILPLLPTETSVGAKYRLELAEHIHAQFEAQEADRTTKLLELREPLLQFSFQPSSTYTSESASEALRVLGAAFGSSRMVLRPPKKTYSPTNEANVGAPPPMTQRHDPTALPLLPPPSIGGVAAGGFISGSTHTHDGASTISDSGAPFSSADAAIMADAFRKMLRKPDFAAQGEGQNPRESGGEFGAEEGYEGEDSGDVEEGGDRAGVLLDQLAEDGRDLQSVGSSRGVKVELPS